MAYNKIHEDKVLFRESISYTAAETTFPERLIEKDYYCTLLLDYFRQVEGIVFKGGTCLAKVHANFYRLSEDLDFTIPMPIQSKKKERSSKMKSAKTSIDKVESELPVFRIKAPLRGANQSSQYIASLEYDSLFTGDTETIKLEISLREPLLEPAACMDAHTILLDPISKTQAVLPIKIQCLSKRESYAEKIRAALTRIDAAIRDYFDIDYAVQNLSLSTTEPELIQLIREKLSVPGNESANVTEERLAELRQQVETDLKPVLRKAHFEQFDLDRSFKIVNAVHSMIIP